MPLLAHLQRHQPPICRLQLRLQLRIPQLPGLKRFMKTSSNRRNADGEAMAAEWVAQARMIRSGAQKSMLAVLEERGFIKDIAGWVWPTLN